jgi:hypothetical protein
VAEHRFIRGVHNRVARRRVGIDRVRVWRFIRVKRRGVLPRPGRNGGLGRFFRNRFPAGQWVGMRMRCTVTGFGAKESCIHGGFKGSRVQGFKGSRVQGFKGSIATYGPPACGTLFQRNGEGEKRITSGWKNIRAVLQPE